LPGLLQGQRFYKLLIRLTIIQDHAGYIYQGTI
jgi:hypothetical protein